MLFQLTLGEPILGSLFVCFHKWRALCNVIGCLVDHAILKTLSQNAEHFVVDHTITSELLICLEAADGIIRIAFVYGRNATEALVIPIRLLLVRLDNGLYEKNRK